MLLQFITLHTQTSVCGHNLLFCVHILECQSVAASLLCHSFLNFCMLVFFVQKFAFYCHNRVFIFLQIRILCIKTGILGTQISICGHNVILWEQLSNLWPQLSPQCAEIWILFTPICILWPQFSIFEHKFAICRNKFVNHIFFHSDLLCTRLVFCVHK